MRRLAEPPQRLYMVAVIWDSEHTVGRTYGPYTRLADAQKCLAKVGDRYTIIESALRWRRREEGAWVS